MENKIGIVYGYFVKHGGISRYIFEILKRMRNQERFNIMTLESNIPLPPNINLDILEIEREKSFLSPKENNDFSYAVKKRISDSDFFLIHSHGVYNFSPDIYTPHICLNAYFNTMKNFFGWEIFKENFRRTTPLIKTEKKMIKSLRDSLIFPVSHKVSKELYNFYGIFPKYIASGSSRFPVSTEKSLNSNNRSKKVGFIGNNIYSKGLVFLKPALDELSKKGFDLECISAGTDKEVNKYMGSGDFKYTPTGMKSIDTSFYKDMDCFFCLSPYEAYSLSTLEAMSQKVPVISSNSNGVFFDKSLKGENFLGEVKNINDPKEIRDLTEKIFGNKKFRENLIEQQIDFSYQNSWKSASNIYDKAYSSF